MIHPYESIRDDTSLVPSEAREAWIRADQANRSLTREYDQLINDESLNDEYRETRAFEAYEQKKGVVEAAGKKARETLLKHAGFAVKSSFPKPTGESLSTNDSTKLLLDQNEAARLVRTVERRLREAPGPFSVSSAELLREEYKRGLQDLQGAEAGAVCRGVLRAAREMGVDPEEIVDPLRGDSHREMLDKARRLEYAADLISSTAPKPPRALTKVQRARVGTYRTAGVVLPDGGSPEGSKPILAGGKKKRKRGFK
jgi:hypothetical protein